MTLARAVIALAVAVAPLAAARAQNGVEFSSTPVFTFTTTAGPERTAQVADLDRLGGGTNLVPRPNHSSVVFLYVNNPTGNEQSLVVEMTGGPKGAVLGRATVDKVPSKTWARVRFTPPPPPEPAAKPAAPPAAPAADAPPAPEAPPGQPVGRGPDGFPITLRLLDANGADVSDAAGKPFGLRTRVTFAKPEDYLTIGEPTAASLVGAGVGTVELSTTVTVKPATPLPPPTTLNLSFPTPFGGQPPRLGNGVYTRTLTPTKDLPTPAATLKGQVRSSEPLLRAYLAVDGVERVKVYEFNPSSTTSRLNTVTALATRVYPVVEPTDAVVRPLAAFPVRVETDNLENEVLELHVRRATDSGDEVGASEVIPLGGPRDERLWVDLAEPAAQGIGLNTRSSDWVVPVNLADVRGAIDLVAVARDAGSPMSKVTGKYRLIVDAYPPQDVTLQVVGLKDERQQVRGKPLQLRATALDAETRVAKAVFFLGQPGEDGKLPADAVAGKREVDEKGNPTGAWVAALPLAADAKGELVVGVVMIDQAGNATVPQPATGGVLRIELVDPPPPAPLTGRIDGILMHGEIPQPGVEVTVFGGIKKVVTTNASGKFCVQGLLPGNYVLAAAVPDVTTGKSAVAEVGVEAEKTTKVELKLKKNK